MTYIYGGKGKVEHILMGFGHMKIKESENIISKVSDKQKYPLYLSLR